MPEERQRARLAHPTTAHEAVVSHVRVAGEHVPLKVIAKRSSFSDERETR